MTTTNDRTCGNCSQPESFCGRNITSRRNNLPVPEWCNGHWTPIPAPIGYTLMCNKCGKTECPPFDDGDACVCGGMFVEFVDVAIPAPVGDFFPVKTAALLGLTMDDLQRGLPDAPSDDVQESAYKAVPEMRGTEQIGVTFERKPAPVESTIDPAQNILAALSTLGITMAVLADDELANKISDGGDREIACPDWKERRYAIYDYRAALLEKIKETEHDAKSRRG